MDGPKNPDKSGQEYLGDYSIPSEHPEDKHDSNSDGVSLHSSAPSMPKQPSQTRQQPIKNRPIAVPKAEVHPISGSTQKYLNHFCTTGSAHSFLSLLNSQKGLDGKFQIVFQPEGNSSPIPLNEFANKGNEAIQAAYEKVSRQIAMNSQPIAYGLMEQMAERQQRMFEHLMQQQRAEFQNQMSALLQVMRYPVIQPVPVHFDYLTNFAGGVVPQQPPAMMGWGGVQGAVSPVPVWAPYPQPMIALQPAWQQPFNCPPLQAGFSAVPLPPPQAGVGLQVPFSPFGHAVQHQPPGLAAHLGYLPQFCGSSPQSFVPPWAYSPFAQQGRQNPVVIHNLNQTPAPQGTAALGTAPVINVKVNPVFNNNVGGSGVRDHRLPEGGPNNNDYDAPLARNKREDRRKKSFENQREARGEDNYSDVDPDLFLPKDNAPLILGRTKPLQPRFTEDESADQIKQLMDEIRRLRKDLENVNSPEELVNLIKELKDALAKNNRITKDNLILENKNSNLEDVIASLEDNIKNLQEDEGKDKRLSARLARQLDQLKNDLQDKYDQIREKDFVIDRQSDEVGRLRKNIGDIKIEIEQLKNRNLDLEYEMRQKEGELRREIGDLESRLRASDSKTSDLNRALNDKNQALSDLQDRYDKQSEDYKNKLEQLEDEKDKIINGLNKKLQLQEKNLLGKISKLESELGSLEDKKRQQERKIIGLERELERLEGVEDKSSKQLAEISSLQHKLQQLEDDVIDKDRSIKKLKSDLQAETELNNELKQKISEIERVVEGEKERHKKDLEGLESDLLKRDEQIKKQEKIIQELMENQGSDPDLRKESEKLESLKKLLDEEKDKYEKELASLRDNLENQKIKSKEREDYLNHQRENLEKRIESMSSEVKDLNRKIADLVAALDIENNKNKNLEEQIEILKRERDEKQAEINQLKDDLSQLKGLLENAAIKNSKLENDLTELYDKLIAEQQQRGLLEEDKKKNEELIASLTEKLAEYENYKAAKDSEIGAAAAKIKELEATDSDNAIEIGRLKKALADLEGERNNDQQQLEGLQVLLDKIKDQKEKARQEADTLKKQVAALEDQISTQTEAIEDQNKQLAELKVNGQEQSTEYQALKAERDKIEQELRDAEQEIDLLKTGLREKEQAIIDLNEALKKAHEDHEAALQAEKTAAETQANQLTEKLDNLKETIATQAEELKKKEDALGRAQAQGEAADDHRQRLEEDCAQLTEQLNASKREAADLQTHLTTVEANITDLEGKLDKANQNIETLREELEQSRTEHEATLKEQGEKARKEADTLNGRVTALEDQINTQTQTIEDLNKKLAELKAQGEEQSNDYQILKAERDKIEEALHKAGQEIDRLKADLIEKEQKIIELDEALKKAHEDHEAALQAEKTAAETQANQLTEKLDNLKETIATQAEELKKKEDALGRAQAQGEAADDHRQRLEEDCAQLTEQLNASKREAADLQTHLTTVEANITDLEGKLDKANQNIETLREELEQSRTEHEATLKEQGEKARKEADTLNGRVTALEDQINTQTQTIEDLNKKLAELKAQGEEQSNDYQILKAERDKIEEALHKAGQEIDRLKADLIEKEQKIIELDEALKKAHEDHEAALQAEKTAAETQANQLTEKLDNLKETIATQAEELKKKEDALGRARAQGEAADDHRQRLEEDCVQLTEQLNASKREAADLQTHLTAVEANITDLEGKLDKANQNIETLREELEQSRTEHEATLKEQEEKVQKDTANLQSKLQSAKKAMDDRASQITKLEADIGKLTSRDGDHTARIAELQNKLTQLQKEYNAAQERVRELEIELAEANRIIVDLKNQLTTLQEMQQKEAEEAEKAERRAKQFEGDFQNADQERQKQATELSHLKGEIQRLDGQHQQLLAKRLADYIGDHSAPSNTRDIILANMKKLEFGIKIPEDEARKVMKMVTVSTKALDKALGVQEKYENEVKALKEKGLPDSLDDDVVTGKELFNEECELDKVYLGKLKDVLSRLEDESKDIGVSNESNPFKKKSIDFVKNEIESACKKLEQHKTELTSAIGYIDTVIENLEHEDKKGNEAIKNSIAKALSKDGTDLTKEINDDFMAVLHSDLTTSADEQADPHGCQVVANSHRALKHLQIGLREILDQEKELINAQKGAKNLDDVEKHRKIYENIRKGIESLRVNKRSHIVGSMSDKMKMHWEKYIDLALSEHQNNFKDVEIDKNSVDVIDRMLNIDEVKKHHEATLNDLKNHLDISGRGLSGVDKAIDLLKTNDEVLESVLSMAARLKGEHKKIKKGEDNIYGGKVGANNKLIAAQKMLNDICDRHGICDRFTPAEMIMALADNASRAGTKAVEIAADRYRAERGRTQKGLRSQKIINQCLDYIAIELDNKDSFWRGVPVDRNNKPLPLAQDPHGEELNRFKEDDCDYINLNGWENQVINNGEKSGSLESGGNGFLDDFYSRRSGVNIKEYVVVGERFISHKKSPVVFQQKKQRSGEFGKVTIDLNGSKREVSPKLYISYPNYKSPFKGAKERDSIPIASTLTGEVGELVQSCETGTGSFSEYYYQVVNEGEFPNTEPVLRCVPITSDNPLEEEFRGSVMGWLACFSKEGEKEGHKKSVKALAGQAWLAYKSLNGNKPEDFKKEVFALAAQKGRHQRSWFEEGAIDKFKERFNSPVSDLANQNTERDGGGDPLEREQMAEVSILLPDSLKIARARHQARKNVKRLNKAEVKLAELPSDFDYHFEEHVTLLKECLGEDHPGLPAILELREKEKNDFKSKVFHDLYELDGVLIKQSSSTISSLTSQVDAMKKQVRYQAEEVMGYVEDCSILEQKVLAMMPEKRKPCSIEEAKQYFGRYPMSIEFAQSMMAYLAVESARDISKGLATEMEQLLDDLSHLELNRIRMNGSEFENKCTQLNKCNFSIARRKEAMRVRLLDDLAMGNLDAQNIAAKKYENTKGTLFRDYQIEPARKLLGAVHKMAENYKSKNPKEREQHHRIVCQLGTGFGKTELSKMLMSQACLEGIGAGYIGPKSNVDNFNQDLWRYTKAAGERCQFIDLKAMFLGENGYGFGWWKDLSNLDRVHNIIKGMPENGKASKNEDKIPWTMSTVDLSALLSLHAHLAKKAAGDLNNPHYLKMEQIISDLSGASRGNRPLVIRDECDTIDDVAENCKEILGSEIKPPQSGNQPLRLCYDCSIHNGIYLSASKDSDYVSVIRAEAETLEDLTKASNKDVTTCELRAEQYLLKARWHLAESRGLEHTVKTALTEFGAERDLVFCDPAYNKVGGCQRMAWDGIAALQKVDKKRNEKIKGHLYFKDGHYYCYSETRARYNKKGMDDQGKISLGERLSEADEAEIRKTGGAGYITWMSETRGYTAAQRNEGPNPTAFVFRNISTLSTPEKQQLLGRDRNIDAYEKHDNLVIFSKEELDGWPVKKQTKFSDIKDEAQTKWGLYDNAKKDLERVLRSKSEHDKGQIMAMLNSGIAFKVEDKKSNDNAYAALKRSFDTAIDNKHQEWGKNLQFRAYANEMKNYAIARWNALNVVKHKALTAISLGIDFSDKKSNLENDASFAAKYALVDSLYQQEKDFIGMDLASYVENCRNDVENEIKSAIKTSKSQEKVNPEFATKAAKKVVEDLASALREIPKTKVSPSTIKLGNEFSDIYEDNKSDGQIEKVVKKNIESFFGNVDYFSSSEEEAFFPIDDRKDRLKVEAIKELRSLSGSIKKLKNKLDDMDTVNSSSLIELSTCQNKIKYFILQIENDDKSIDYQNLEKKISDYIKDMLDALSNVYINPPFSNFVSSEGFKDVLEILCKYFSLEDGKMDISKSSGIITIPTVASAGRTTLTLEYKDKHLLWSVKSLDHKKLSKKNFNAKQFKGTNAFQVSYDQESYNSLRKIDKDIKSRVKSYFVSDKNKKEVVKVLKGSFENKQQSLALSAKDLDFKLKKQKKIKINK